MGTYNFSNEYLTDWSFEDSNCESQMETILTEQIDNIKTNEFTTGIGKFSLILSIDSIEIEYGYYSGCRYIPNINCELLYDSYPIYKYELEYLEGECETYIEALDNFLLDELNTSSTPAMRNFFRKINDILVDNLTPKTVGWVASEIDKMDAISDIERE